jgi:hypothetical protein
MPEFGNYSGRWRTSNDSILLISDANTGQEARGDTLLYGFSSSYQFLYLQINYEWNRYSRVDSSAVVTPWVIHRAYPCVTGPKDTTVAVMDTIVLHATGVDSGPATIEKYLWSHEGGFGCDTVLTPAMSMIFGKTDTGSRLFSVKVIDDHGKVSLPSFFEITVKQYPPSVRFQDTSFYLNQKTVIHALATDTNGTVCKYYWSLTSDTSTATATPADSLEWRFTDLGTYTFQVIAEDDDGIKSLPATGTVSIMPHTYGTAAAENGVAVARAFDGGFIIAGNCSPSGLIVRTDSAGFELWRKQYDGGNFQFFDVITTANNGIAVVGSGGNRNVVFLSLDGDGNELAAKTIPSSSFEEGESITQLPDGGFLICGYSRNPADTTTALVYRIDNAGNVLWTKRFARSQFDYAQRIILTSDGAAMVLCYSMIERGYLGNLGAASYLMKINLNGDQLWSSTLTNAFFSDLPFYTLDGTYQATSIQETSDNGFMIAGLCKGNGTGWHLTGVFKIAMDSSIVLFKTLGSQVDYLNTVVHRLPSGGFLFANTADGGYYAPPSISLNYTDGSANETTTKYLGEGTVNGCCTALDGNIVMVGQSKKYGMGNGDIVLMKVDATGTRMW